MAAYDAYAHTPQKLSSKHEQNTHKRKRRKPGVYVKEEIGIQNMTERKKKVGIHIIRTIGNTQRGGGT